MSHVIYILNNIVQLSIILFFMNNLIKPKAPYIVLELMGVIPFTVIYLIGTFVFEWTLGNVLFNILRNVPLIVTVLLLYEGSIWKKALSYINVFALLVLCSLLSSPLSINMFSVTYDDVHYVNFMQNVGMMTWSDMAIITTIVAICVINRKNNFFRYNKRNIVLMIFFPLIHLCFLYAYFRNIGDLLDVRTVLIHLVYQAMMISLIIIQFNALQKSHNLRETDEKLRRLQSEIYHTYEYCMLANQKFSEISVFRHDINNHMQTILHLLDSGNGYDEAEELLSQLQERLKEASNTFFCINPTVNAVLADKISRINKREIICNVLVDDCRELVIENQDLCSLVVNLLECSIKACDTEGQAVIELSDRYENGSYIISSVNNHCTDPQAVQSFGETEIIRNITLKYGGGLTVGCEKNRLYIMAELKI